MGVKVALGIQWGDEGKAKIVDYLSSESDLVVRFQGGANAGHTVIVGDEKFILHLIPSGIIYNKDVLIGSGVVADLKSLTEEMEYLKNKGIDISKIYIDKRVHLVLPYHKILDGLKESKNKNSSIGTTKRGIGPAYSDKASRVGIRLYDLFDRTYVEEKVKEILEEKNFIIKNFYNFQPLDFNELMDELYYYFDIIKEHIVDEIEIIDRYLYDNKNILLEGAQGTMLDIDFGTYPFVTSSNTISGYTTIGAAIPLKSINEIIGIMKAYTTRVGNGPFPTEDTEEIGEFLRNKGNEYGATTGRPRRCGWLDLKAVKYAVRLNNITSIALTKIDVLTGLDKIKIAVDYKIDGESVYSYPVSELEYRKIELEYIELDGWNEDISYIKSFDDLPKNTQKFIKFIEDYLNVPINIISVGPLRRQTFIK